MSDVGCQSCVQKQTQIDNEKISKAINRGIAECKSISFAIVQTVNKSGYMWREIDDPDCQRLNVVKYYIKH